MARPREFDENALLDAAMQCFWAQGYEATSVKDLTSRTGVTAASLYNAYGDKRGLFQSVLDRYIAIIMDRIQRAEALPPREAITYFFEEILRRSLNDEEHKGCMLVNSALELAPHDPAFQVVVADGLTRLETFFFRSIQAGQSDGSISSAIPARQLAQHLLAVMMGVRVLARARPERELLEGAVFSLLTVLRPVPSSGG